MKRGLKTTQETIESPLVHADRPTKNFRRTSSGVGSTCATSICSITAVSLCVSSQAAQQQEHRQRTPVGPAVGPAAPARGAPRCRVYA